MKGADQASGGPGVDGAQVQEPRGRSPVAGSAPNVTIQVLPLNSALPIEQYVSFSILGLQADPPVEVVWLEHITGGTLLEQNLDVQAYGKAWDELTAAALSPTASRQYIRDLVEESRS
ncbi:Scr1 family TA system antitoxin-like transcriptional regulator [Streptomyces sp. Cmuel-A718b]|uniref:Scr1 family TA system antitoxin-like transcriptional regulator n=1 Tax=Streptomyces sp. Cmuel-A718b TaxID=697328 RepID=UPI0023D8852A|nr:Scr1 family TA system antitoxin-like transcriptional regulator [Streptomyces sp. Cmuel-A718b]